VAQLADKTTEITPPPCIARLSSSSFQISVLTAKLKMWASSRAFNERLCLVFTIGRKMESPDFFAVCRTVTSPRHLLAPPPFLKRAKAHNDDCRHKQSDVDCAEVLNV
jgi:hypothetical protein